jgi:predicted  nucleic acid-binding Zn-ribbon protein
VASTEFQTLLAVQDHDTAIDRLQHRREAMPERSTRQELLARRQALTATRDTIAAQRDEVAQREAELEGELAASEERINQIDKRMYSGEISAARDLQAMGGEIERLKGFCSDIEDRAIAALEEREPLDAQIAEIEEQLGAIDADLGAVETAIEANESVIDEELMTEEIAREGLVAEVPQSLLDRYDTLRKKLGGVGAAPLNGHSCGGCHLTLPATEIDRIKREPADALILCDQCGRILVRPA